ncbi:MAG: hypothetical protein IJR27_01455 [Synergistaceae bacterium]|nr:hypothetical protein [Synergistaceae bacterium]MBQ9573926.1 hypothetical protein [Synergistaceae bacterium]
MAICLQAGHVFVESIVTEGRDAEHTVEHSIRTKTNADKNLHFTIYALPS